MGGVCFAEPADHGDQVGFREGGAASRGSVWPAAEMKEDGAAGPGNRFIAVVPDLDEPAVGEIAVAHLLLFEPGRRLLRIDHDMLVVERAEGGIIDPGVRLRDRPVGVFRPGGQLRIRGIDLADPENAGGGAFVALLLDGRAEALAGHADAPGQSF